MRFVQFLFFRHALANQHKNVLIYHNRFYCLNRRSQKKSYNWVEFLNMLDNSYPLVRPRIYVNIYE